MTEQAMHERLRASGERWRAANTDVVEVDPTAWRRSVDTIEALQPPGHDGPSRTRHRWALVGSAAGVVAALVLALTWLGTRPSAAPNDGSTSTISIAGVIWQLITYTDASGRSGAPNKQLRFLIDDTRHFVADDGCTVMSADAQLGAGALALHNLVHRYRSCVAQTGASLEPAADPILRGPAHYSISGGTLTVTRPGAGTLRFTAAPPGIRRPTLDVATLTGTDWRLSSYTAQGRSHTSTNGARLHLDETGGFTASDGCNSLSGRAQASGDVVRFSNVVSTELPCPSSTGTTTVPAVGAMLAGAVRWTVANDTLTLTKLGAGTLTYRAAPQPSTEVSDLVNISWHLASLESGTGQNSTALTPSAISTLHIGRGGEISGDDGCNSMQGRAVLGSGTMVVRSLGGTLELCQGGRGSQESLIYRVLNGTVSWSVADGQLTIVNAGVGALSYASQ